MGPSIYFALIVATCFTLEFGKAQISTELGDADWETLKSEVQKQCTSPHHILNHVQNALQASKIESSIKQIGGNDRRIKRSFYTEDYDTFSSRGACLRFCFQRTQNRNIEVCQISYTTTSTDLVSCRVFNLRASFLRAFPNRYMEVNNDRPGRTYEVYYDGSKDDMPKTTPILFYALDGVSQNTNLGSLDSWKFSLNMGPTAPRYDCEANSSKQKFLRLVPNDRFLIQIPYADSIPFPQPRHFTLILWMKKNNPNQFSAPLIEATSSGHTVSEWWLWNHDKANQIFPLFGRQVMLFSQTLSTQDWNVIAFRANDNNLELFVNNKLQGRQAISNAVRSLGDHIYIGRRIGNPNGYGLTDYMFDGCIANLMMFTSALSDEDIFRYSKLLSDPNF
jgi:hypothetical protein